MIYRNAETDTQKPRNRFFKRKHRFLFSPFRLRSKIHLVPHIFTLGNAFFGFCSIIVTAHGQLVASAYLILIGALMDACDGRVARYLGKTSDLGMQLDSLCDAISFCCAPAILVYFWQLKKFGFLGLAISASFILAGLLRLARFNLIHHQQTIHFTGLPTTMAGCFLATVLLNFHPTILKPFGTFTLASLVLCLAGLMISKVPFPAFKKVTKNYFVLASMIISAIAIIMGFTKLLLIIFMSYFLYSFGKNISHY